MARSPASASTGMTLRYRKDRLAVGRPGLDVSQPKPVDLGVPRQIAEIGQVGETVLGSAQHLHGDMLSRTRPHGSPIPAAPAVRSAGPAGGHRSRTRSPRGWEQQISALPAAGSSTGSGA